MKKTLNTKLKFFICVLIISLLTMAFLALLKEFCSSVQRDEKCHKRTAFLLDNHSMLFILWTNPEHKLLLRYLSQLGLILNSKVMTPQLNNIKGNNITLYSFLQNSYSELSEKSDLQSCPFQQTVPNHIYMQSTSTVMSKCYWVTYKRSDFY